ncbi:hypothetical protein FB566_1059 [Stackebrandtia endophytica]|uniref:Uncharacterized protein n=1 Tax=Stackebrandtia endophytica TaxID=1496996 RepID=A0A543ASK1_9ACTN|nr:hypothetical protein FB566_1059 [Stackebrandtia endophytica]
MTLPLESLAVVLTTLAVPTAMAIRHWFHYRTTVAKEAAKSARLHTAINGTDPNLRSEIIRACSTMESGAPVMLPPLETPCDHEVTSTETS